MQYEGDFIDGRKEGIGKEENNLFTFEGQYENNMKHGKGKIIFNKVNKSYEGEFDRDRIQGHGVMKFENDDEYIGKFVDGELHGYGIYKFSNLNSYIGFFNKGIKEGFGKMSFANGKILEGQFKEGKINGEGTLFTDGKIYKLEFKKGVIINKKGSLNQVDLEKDFR